MTDPGSGTLQFAFDVIPCGEDNGSISISVTRTGGNTGAVSIQYATSDGTAVAGQDYVAASGTLSFESGENSKSFAVTILDDAVPEDFEFVNLTLSNPQGGAALGGKSVATISIGDNDTAVGNVSTRLPVGTGDNALIEGFIVEGPAGSTKKIIVRAIGPSLTPFGIPDALANPTLEIHDASANNATVATNDDWRNTQVGGLITGDQSAEIASSRVPPSDDLESAIIANLAPGSYTAVVRGAGDTVGTGVVDAYDLSPASPARLANIATRGLIQPGDKLMIAGFIIQSGPVRAVVRAIGPSLSAFGITNALPDTTLQLRDSNGFIVRENDDWQTDQKQELESIGLQPTNDLEAALVATIPPGQYTAQVRGKPETTGIGVVQVYFLQ
jgi:Calx-beta domain